jgi:hypothetical protein
MKETKVYTINGMPLFKFQDKEKINSLREGTLYAKTLKYYRDKEQETGDADIGDEFEAMIHINKGYMYIPDTSEIYSLDDTLIRTIHSDDYVFCMFGISPNTKDFEFSEVQKEKMIFFGDTALLIFNHDEFLRRVARAAKNIGYKAYYGKVQYYNPDIDGGNFLLSLIQGMWKIAFWKRKRYSYQQEYRFLFVPEKRRNKSEEDHIILNLGDLSDITEVVSSNQALTSFAKRKEDV